MKGVLGRGGREGNEHLLSISYMPSAFVPVFSLLILTITGEVGIITCLTDEKTEAG